jgi:DNA-binding beta-propeller fold protein YncE
MTTLGYRGALAMGVWAGASVLAAGSAHAGNFPPVAKASAMPSEALVGEPIAFSSAGSLDPDGGPQPLGFAWDFGDGAISSEPEPTHAYDGVGTYIVSLTVDDGAASTFVNVDVVVLEPPTAVAPSKSSPIALSPDESLVLVANTDSGSVSFIDLSAGDAVTELPVCVRPRTVAFDEAGLVAFVTCEDGDVVARLDVATMSAAGELAMAPGPFGVAVVPGDGRLVVTHPMASLVTIVDPDDPVAASVVTVARDPRAIAIAGDGSTAYVGHFVTRDDVGHVSILDLSTSELSSVVDLVEDMGPDTASSGRGFPNLLGAAAIEPAGAAVWIGGLKSNTQRGIYVDGNPLVPRNRVRGVMLRVDAGTGLEQLARRLDTNDADSVSGIAFSPLGRYAYLLHQGAAQLSVYDLPEAALVMPGDGSTASFEARIDVGDAPQGIVVSADGSRAWIGNALSRDVSVVDLTDPAAAAVIDTIAVTDEPLPAEVANGKRLFHRSRAPVHSDQNYIACASCHPDGGHDGRTWDFTQVGEGLRNTIDLHGKGGTAHGPVHWSANFDEIQDFENDIVNGFGGLGLANDGAPPHAPLDGPPNAGRSQDLDDLAAYVASLGTFPRSPHRAADGSLSDAALRGRDLFFDAEVGCAECHVPPRFTDSELLAPVDYLLHDVGTITEASGGRLGGPLPGLDTPSLLGVWSSPPYLHDGSAALLRDVISTRNPGDQHGRTSALSPDELDDLEQYLLELQGSADEIPAGWDDGGSSSSDGGSSGAIEGSSGTSSADDDGATSGVDANEPASSCACHSSDRGRAAILSLVVALARRRRPRSHRGA